MSEYPRTHIKAAPPNLVTFIHAELGVGWRMSKPRAVQSESKVDSNPLALLMRLTC